jgi:hypothetical protein
MKSREHFPDEIAKYVLFLISAFCFGFNTPLSSQELIFKASAPDTVCLGELFSITYSINRKLGSINPSSFEGFVLISKPVEFSNSRMKKNDEEWVQLTTSFYSYELQSVDTGLFLIAGAEYFENNRTYKSDSLKIYVSGSKKEDHTSSENQFLKRDLFLSISYSKTEVNLNDEIVVIYTLYLSNCLVQNLDIELPVYEGFVSSGLKADPVITNQYFLMNGQVYQTLEYRVLIKPQKTGKMDISGGKIILTLSRGRNGTLKPGVSIPKNGKSQYVTVEQVLGFESQAIIVNP